MSTTRNTVGGVSVAWLAVLEARLVPIGIGRLMDSSMNRRTPFAACQSRASCLGEPCPHGAGAKDSAEGARGPRIPAPPRTIQLYDVMLDAVRCERSSRLLNPSTQSRGNRA